MGYDQSSLRREMQEIANEWAVKHDIGVLDLVLGSGHETDGSFSEKHFTLMLDGALLSQAQDQEEARRAARAMLALLVAKVVVEQKEHSPNTNRALAGVAGGAAGYIRWADWTNHTKAIFQWSAFEKMRRTEERFIKKKKASISARLLFPTIHIGFAPSVQKAKSRKNSV